MNVDQTINAVYNEVISPVTLSCWLYRHLPFKKKKTVEIIDDACPKFSEIPTEAETDKIDATWPPAPHPVEALSVHDLFRANGKLIRDLCYATTLSEEESEKFLLPVITNLARIVHLTPASEYDHHQGYGGLFTHSLEVAYYAANDAKTTIFDRSASPKDLYMNKRRWILTAVLAALAHDIGKPFTDMKSRPRMDSTGCRMSRLSTGFARTGSRATTSVSDREESTTHTSPPRWPTAGC